MKRQIINPSDRAVLEVSGYLDFSAPSIQKIFSPTNQQELWIDSGLPPVRWTTIKVIRDPAEIKDPIEVSQDIPKSFEKPVIQPFVPQPLKDIFSGIKNIGIWLVAVLILIFLIRRQK